MISQVNQDVGRKATGYVLNSAFSIPNQEVIVEIQKQLQEKFPGLFWVPPPETLHVTLMDWVAPLVEYGKDKDLVFSEIETRYISVFQELIQSQGPIQINFSEIKVSPTAIFIKGKDDGSYQRLRDSFLEEVSLLSGTKLPPKIIHSSIARFTKAQDMEEVSHFVSTLRIGFVETVTEFRLIRETEIPMLGFETIQKFQLK